MVGPRPASVGGPSAHAKVLCRSSEEGVIRAVRVDDAGWVSPRSDAVAIWRLFTGSWMSLLLLAVPFGWIAHFVHWGSVPVFVLVRAPDLALAWHNADAWGAQLPNVSSYLAWLLRVGLKCTDTCFNSAFCWRLGSASC